MSDHVRIHEEVLDALTQGTPVVALETAVLTHGLPRTLRPKAPPVFDTSLATGCSWDDALPVNLATVRAMAQTIRHEGGVPASSCILDGILRIGLEPDELQRLADVEAEKCSTRDLARVMATAGIGGTTVAGTLAACVSANHQLSKRGVDPIRFFATGGIGGVHRQWNSHADVSADLQALAISPLVVVSAGAKVILDLAATREALDTNQIPVLGWQVGHFPRFTVQGRPGELAIPRIRKHQELASLCAHHWTTLGRSEAILLMNELPEALALDDQTVEQIVEEAMDAAVQDGINGQALTPFLLEYMARKTGGEALEANIALLMNNARLAAQVASSVAQDQTI